MYRLCLPQRNAQGTVGFVFLCRQVVHPRKGIFLFFLRILLLALKEKVDCIALHALWQKECSNQVTYGWTMGRSISKFPFSKSMTLSFI
jgi:hypothetical protein